MCDQQPTGIHQAMAAILAEIPSIGKDNRNKDQGFQYRGIDDVYNALHPLLAKHKVFMAPTVLSRTSEDRTTAKGGVMQLCKAFSNDLLQYGINVNAIAPGYMDTEMNVALTDPKNPKFTQQRYDELTQRIPAHRWGTPDDMKGCCIFLASHASDYLGGAIIPVDGGYLVM